jgi:cytochrome P450 family 142 subfamily A polypeptide 1
MTAIHPSKPDVDLTDGIFVADGGAREAYRWMRANEPVFRDRNGLAAAATYQAVLDAERNPELFSSAGGIRPDNPAMPYMIDMDDPAHLLRRKLVNAGFTRKRVTDKAPGIDALCDTLIDAVCERGECDFVRDLAAPLPMAVIGDMLGVLPEDRATLLKWSDDLVCRRSWRPSPATPRSPWRRSPSAAPSRPMTCFPSWSTPRSTANNSPMTRSFTRRC